MKRNEIVVFDCGDSSVGLQSLEILIAELNVDFIDFMKEQGTFSDFRKKLQDLVEEFMQPETCYDNYMEEDEDWRFEADDDES